MMIVCYGHSQQYKDSETVCQCMCMCESEKEQEKWWIIQKEVWELLFWDMHDYKKIESNLQWLQEEVVV